jgi:hypothetical protein
MKVLRVEIVSRDWSAVEVVQENVRHSSNTIEYCKT